MEQDLDKVLAFLNKEGFSFERAWLLPQIDFRFPKLAEVECKGKRWSLRRAMEPWPLLGEQPAAGGGIVRCVDSSTERLELRLDVSSHEQFDEGQIVFSVNGWKMPLTPHPMGGFFGAVRFRTILLPTCLNPHVMPHTPLLFQMAMAKGDGTEPAEILGQWYYSPLPTLTSEVQSQERLVAVTPLMIPGKIQPSQHQGTQKTLDLLAV